MSELAEGVDVDCGDDDVDGGDDDVDGEADAPAN